MSEQRAYAHSLPGFPSSGWELLDVHLADVASQCAEFASAFGARDWGHTLGQCHDLGKASAEFQAKLLFSDVSAPDVGAKDQVPGRVDHSTYGARYVHRMCTDPAGICGWLLAYAVAGHHAGLANWSADRDSELTTLPYRLSSRYRIPYVPDQELTLPSIGIPWSMAFSPERKHLALRTAGFSYALFTRMVFSSLIDADRLCTEAFCDKAQAEERRQSRPSLFEMRAALNAYLEAMQASAAPTIVNASRCSVLEQCIAAASTKPGFFSLQVPTGGGKTLASLAFALEHAANSGASIRRIIVAIPFTSIIEQTADVYRNALSGCGASAVIEHHTNVQAGSDTRANQLATENWDAPLIVTTNVQLFESLFAARTTPCRKLHRIANSVIILDEAQTIPVDLLEPTLAALRELVDHYGCSVVLCTATQPALERSEDFDIGIEGVRAIIADPKPLFDCLRRVEVQPLGPIDDDHLTRRLESEPRVLCIVNTRAHAARLFEKLRTRSEENTCFHLSTLMCGAHRREVLKLLRKKLAEQETSVRIISTQLIEAGVDIDLPVVYRAAAGLDSVAQAAGRCNREGQLPLGRTYLFDAEQGVPSGFLRQAAETGRETLKLHTADPLSPEAINAYFRQLYWRKRHEWDKHHIMDMTELVPNNGKIEPHFQFRSIEEEYRLIRDTQLPILIPFDNIAREFTRELSSGFVEFVAQRKLQPYLVNVPEKILNGMIKNGIVQQHESGVGLLLREDAYDPATGLRLDGLGLDPQLWGM